MVCHCGSNASRPWKALHHVRGRKAGSGGWIRTNDQRINSPLRYRCATPDHLAARPLAEGFGVRNRAGCRSRHLHGAGPARGREALCLAHQHLQRSACAPRRCRPRQLDQREVEAANGGTAAVLDRAAGVDRSNPCRQPPIKAGSVARPMSGASVCPCRAIEVQSACAHVAGREGQHPGGVARQERDAGPGRTGERGRDAGHNLSGDPGLGAAGLLLADEDARRVTARHGRHLIGQETVVDDRVCPRLADASRQFCQVRRDGQDGAAGGFETSRHGGRPLRVRIHRQDTQGQPIPLRRRGTPDYARGEGKGWRSEAELNRRRGFCRPLPDHSAIGPLGLSIVRRPARVKAGFGFPALRRRPITTPEDRQGFHERSAQRGGAFRARRGL